MSIEAAPDRPTLVRDALFPFSRPRFGLGLALVSAALLAAFHAVPASDIAVSDLFFRPETCPAGVDSAMRCGVFPLAHAPGLGTLRQGLRRAPIVAAVAVVVLVLWNHSRRRWGREWQVTAVLALFSVAIATLLLTDTLLKTYGGRPRPIQTTLFGGSLPFVPAGDFSGQCASNCSFVSSEASAAFWLVCLVVLLPKSWRPAGYAVTLTIAAGTSALRVAFGAHFLSDVTMAGLISILVFSLAAVAASSIAERHGSLRGGAGGKP